MSAEGAVAIINGKQIKAAEDPVAEKARMISDYENEFMTPYIAVEKGFIIEVIFQRRPEPEFAVHLKR